MIDYEKIALQYARKYGYDSVRPAGEKDGLHYFRIYTKALLGHKLGWPQFVRIAENGSTSRVENMAERSWAVRQEIRLNNL